MKTKYSEICDSHVDFDRLYGKFNPFRAWDALLKAKGRLDKVRTKGTKTVKDRAVEWRDTAVSLAKKHWASDSRITSRYTTKKMADVIYFDFKDRGGFTPSRRSIRNALAGVRKSVK